MDNKIAYALGQRDAIAGLFALIRVKGVEDGLKEVVSQYKKAYDEPNPHVEWYLKEVKK